MVDPPAGGLLSRTMTYYVYSIYNLERDNIYIGHTSDLVARLKRHNQLLKNKPTSYTSKNSGNWILTYTEEFITRQEAVKREKQLKSFRGREFLRGRINR